MNSRTADHFYTSFQDFTRLTCELIQIGELDHLKACFDLAEKLYREGEWAVKHIIQDTYISSLHQYVDHSALRVQIIRLLPVMLKQEYDRQTREPDVASDISTFVIHLN